MAAEIGSDTGLFSSNIDVFVLVHKREILCLVFLSLQTNFVWFKLDLDLC